MAMFKETFRRRLIDGVTMLIVAGLSLSVLVYVGFGEGKRTYEQIQIEKLTAQGRIVQNSIENYIRAGLPLRQFVGFATLAEPIVALADIDAMAVYDQSGRQLFLVVDKSKPKLPEPSSAIARVKQKIQVDQGDTHYQVILPLRTRFETAGSLVVFSSNENVVKHLRTSFQPLLYLIVGLSVLFTAVVLAGARYLARTRAPWLQIGYGITFLTMAAVVIGTLVALYYDGVQGKAKASAFTLSQRLSDIFEFKLSIKDFEGIDKTFSEFRRVNPEISEAALISGDAIEISTEPTKQGKPWLSDSRNFEYTLDLTHTGQADRTSLTVTVPRDIVYQRVARSVKNFAALFIASAFLAGLFLQVAQSMQSQHSAGTPSDDAAKAAMRGEMALTIVKPVFFLGVFIENMTYSFLPKFVQEAATASGVSVGFASVPFTLYYLCFALSLIPSGTLSDRYGPKPLIWPGLILSSISLLSLAMPLGIAAISLLRALSGIGQGMLFIGIQAYILAVASPEKKTQGAAIIVFGFQGGMISGMAMGSLLVNFLQPQGVFWLSGVVGFLTALYSILLIPRDIERKQVQSGMGTAIRRVGSDLKKVIGSSDFLKTMFCIGVPAKGILTGTISFALPLLLGQLQYRQEDIGQIIMFYGLGVIVASGYISRVVDRTRKTETILFWGAVISGIGLMLIGCIGSEAVGSGVLGTIVVIIGVVVVGIAHGFINAPVVTHVAHSDLAARIGANPVTTTYRFLERVGHIAGPFVVSQLFLVWGQSPYVIGWIGVATAVLGFLFLVRTPPPRVGTIGQEATR